MLIILWDGFETIILPRRVVRKVRLTRLFYRYTWLAWSRVVGLGFSHKRSETYLSYYGPLSLILLLVVWAAGLVFGFGLLHWAVGSAMGKDGPLIGFGSYLYFSGTNFATLGLGDISPVTAVGRFLTTLEAALGLGFLALILGYLPGLNESFVSREAAIALLDSRAGSPPTALEVFRRNDFEQDHSELREFLTIWERWASELLSNHLSYPVLAFFRSQHDNQSWLAALTVVLDTASLAITHLDGPLRSSAQRAYAMARHAIVDLSLVFNTPPSIPDHDRLPPPHLQMLMESLRECGFKVTAGADKEQKLSELRQMYEPYLHSLSDYLCLAVPPWIPGDAYEDNWRTTAWGEATANREQPRGAGVPDRHF